MGYVTNNNRERDRKEAQKRLNKNLKEENLNRLLNNKLFYEFVYSSNKRMSDTD